MRDPTAMRLDQALVARGLARSRTEAQDLIRRGQVLVAGQAICKPSFLVTSWVALETQGVRCPFVSRGGIKLAAALDAFGLDVAGRTALDIGASTGGFSDCLLQRGAAHVDAVDVGHGQLAPALTGNPRLTYREGVNARGLAPHDFPTRFALIVADLSFISLTLVLPVLPPLLEAAGDLILLVKPQFEVGAGQLGKGGVVRDAHMRQTALARVQSGAQTSGLVEAGCIDSPITGSDGNQEFLLWLTLGAGKTPIVPE